MSGNCGTEVSYKRPPVPSGNTSDDAELYGLDVEEIDGPRHRLVPTSLSPFILSNLLPFFTQAMSSAPQSNFSSPPSASSTPREGNNRRGCVKVPCDDCIQRASDGGNNAFTQLCEQCMRSLHRPRRRQRQAPTANKVRRHTNAIIDTALGLHTDPVTLPWSEDRQTQHALQFFVQHSAPQLAGYFDSPFWQRTLLQSGRHEPAVKHAIAAIGALHERLLMGAEETDASHRRHTRFALEQCNKSIQHLTTPTEGKDHPDLRLMLTTCVLFTCFEAMQGHCEQAIAHATQGYGLLKQYATAPETNPCEAGTFAVELDQLCLTMQRLQTQSKGLMGKDYGISLNSDKKDIPKPVRFDTLRDARVTLEQVINRLAIFFLDLDLNDNFYDLVCSNAEKFLSFAPWLKAWEEAFSRLLAEKQNTMTPNERKGAMVLKAHHLVCEILSNVDLSEGELGWDKFHGEFTAILDLAKAVLEDGPQPVTRQTSPKTELCFSLGIVDPLYEVCARCRDPALRRRALDLLARHPRQDCMWSSWSAWKVGKYLMQLEEEPGSSPPLEAGDIKAADRISEAWVDFSASSDGVGHLKYKRTTPQRNPREALNPGLFAENPSRRQLGQEIDFAHAMLGSNFLDAQGTPTASGNPSARLGSTPTLSRSNSQSEQLSPKET